MEKSGNLRGRNKKWKDENTSEEQHTTTFGPKLEGDLSRSSQTAERQVNRKNQYHDQTKKFEIEIRKSFNKVIETIYTITDIEINVLRQK